METMGARFDNFTDNKVEHMHTQGLHTLKSRKKSKQAKEKRS